MNTDIRLQISFRENRKRKKLHLKHGADGVLALIDLWLGVAVSKPSGVLCGWNETDIALEANFKGDHKKFVSDLLEIGFLDKDDNDNFVMHDWEEHNPYASEAQTRSDKARFSKMKGNYPQLWSELYKKGVRQISSKKYKEKVNEWLNREGQLGNESLTSRNRNVKETSTPSPSPSPSPTPKDTKREKTAPASKAKKFDHNDMKPKEVPDELWTAFIDNRKHKKLQNTELALKTILNAFAEGIRAGYTYEQMITRYVSSGMQRFKVEWMRDKGEDGKKQGNHRDKYALELLNET